MVAKPYHADTELAALLQAAKASGDVVHIVADDETFVLYVRPPNGHREVDDLFANYDPEKVLKALDSSFGVLQGVDVEELLADIRAERAQHGRDDVE
jgi:hypothetical protein